MEEEEIELEAFRKRVSQEERAERGKKLFVGGLKFQDLSNNCDDDDDERRARLKLGRIEYFQRWFSVFGRVDYIKEHWDEGYCHVVYKSKQDARAALSKLRSYEVRKKLADETAEMIIQRGQPVEFCPSPSFYIRWPKKHTKRS